MNIDELQSFFTYCDDVSAARLNAFFLESDEEWPESRQVLYMNGTIIGLYREHDSKLLSRLGQRCNHEELIHLLDKELDECEKSEQSLYIKQIGAYSAYKKACEPLIEWIADYNYMLAYPLVNSKEELLADSNPEQVMGLITG